MKKIIMTLVALATMTLATAQNNNQQRRAPREITPEQMTERMTEQLGLSDDQKAKVLALNTKYKDVLRGPGMRRGRPQGQRPDGQTGATQQAGSQQGSQVAQNGSRPERPELTEAQKKEMEQQMQKRKEYDEQLKKLLTDEQYKKYQQSQRRGGQGQRGGRRGQRGGNQSSQQ